MENQEPRTISQYIDDILSENKMNREELLAIIERWKEERKEDK